MTHSILLAEDERNLVEALTFLMQRAGFAVSVARDGPTAVEMALRAPPDLVILDIMLPGCDGFEVLAQMKRDARLAGTRVIMLTAKGREDDRVKAMALGVDDYVTKPFSNSDVVARVRSLLGTPA